MRNLVKQLILPDTGEYTTLFNLYASLYRTHIDGGTPHIGGAKFRQVPGLLVRYLDDGKRTWSVRAAAMTRWCARVKNTPRADAHGIHVACRYDGDHLTTFETELMLRENDMDRKKDEGLMWAFQLTSHPKDLQDFQDWTLLTKLTSW